MRADREFTEYSWHCFTCHTTRRYGAARLRADLDAGKHSRDYPGHEVATLITKIINRLSVYDSPQLALDAGVPF